ncbi:MAG: DUF4129 domain-containing protein [Bacillota bacterium]
MKSSKKREVSLHALGQGAVELFFYLPLLLIVAVYLLPASAMWLWIATLPFCYWAGSTIIGMFPQTRLFVRVLLAAMIGGLHSCLFNGAWLGELELAPTAICGLVGLITAARGMSAKMKGWTASFPNSYLLVGVLSYVSVQPLKLFLFKRLADYNGVLIICGIAAVILFFFLANERHLNSETADTGKSPAIIAFKRQNRILMAIIVTIISILALFRQIQQAIERFFLALVGKLMSWFNRPQEQQPIEEAPVNNPTPDMFPAAQEKPASEWMLLLEQILKIIGIALVIIVICIVLFIVFRKLYQAAKTLAAKLLERGAEKNRGEAGFTDEVENLMTLTSIGKQMGNQLQKLFPRKRKNGEDWNDLKTNAERIRFLYTRLVRAVVKQGYPYQTHLTPRETARDLSQWKGGTQQLEGINGFIDFIDIYEKVRYGEGIPDDQQVAAYKQNFDSEKK